MNISYSRYFKLLVIGFITVAFVPVLYGYYRSQIPKEH